ncbi:head GIN domain-containing protein [Rhodothalassium salexigens]|nr:head GIN domain-containing protein [Rhodothalassium salexigens]MBB4212490.1 hypothetical protein [Rhodothalassium salexigens DSM 2132]MBK1638460.1 hypothetical protein [Rhodothalassium salexigens DSM 2132]
MMRPTFPTAVSVPVLAAAGLIGAALWVAPGPDASAHEDHDRGHKTVTQTRAVDGFTQLHIEGGMDLNVVAGEDFAVTVTTRDDHQDKVETTVEDGVLTIDDDRNRIAWGDRNDIDVEVRVALPMLEALVVDGAVDADLALPDAGDLRIEINGAADLEAEGSCDSLIVEVNGAGDIDLEDLHCKAVDIALNGAGDASVYASERVKARINGVGEIDVYGKPDRVDTRDGLLGSIDVHD